MRKNKKLFAYTKQMSRHIDNKKVRQDIQEEIYSHLLDSLDSYLYQGMDDYEAEQAVIYSMESANNLGQDFDRVHTPKIKWWLWLIIIVFAFTMIAATFMYINYGWKKANEQEVQLDKQVFFYDINY